MGFKVNPDSWLPMGQYVRLVSYFLTHDDEPSPYDSFYKNRWDKRLANVKTLDGPIHTLWVWQTRIRYNWFTIGLRCHLKGHDFSKENIASADDYEYVLTEPGRAKRKPTGKTRIYRVYVCEHCGKYRGMNYEVIDRA